MVHLRKSMKTPVNLEFLFPVDLQQRLIRFRNGFKQNMIVQKNIYKKGKNTRNVAQCPEVLHGFPDIRYKVVLHSQQSWFHT